MTIRSDIDRYHPPTGSAPQTAGVMSRWTQELVPVRERVLRTGELVELLVTVDGRRYTLDEQSRIRFDILEEDFILTGWDDDRIVSLVGTRAEPPHEKFVKQSRTTYFVRRETGVSLADAVREFKRLHPADYTASIVVFATVGAVPQYDILAWWDTQFDCDFGNPEFYFIVNVTERFDDKSDETISVSREQAPPTASGPHATIRISGRLVDAHPFDPKVPESLHWIELRGGGTAARTNREGRFTLDALFGMGEHDIEMKQPGIDPVTLTVKAEEAGGVCTVTVRNRSDGREVAAPFRGPLPGAAGRIDVVLRDDLKIIVHKLRGIVYWPDSRRLLAAGIGPPRPRGMTARRKRVFVMPVTEGTTQDRRPATTRELARWSTREDVIGSGRPGRFADAELTAANGAFELKFVDLTAGRRYLIWVESPEPGEPDTSPTSPEFVVRSVPARLQRVTAGAGATDAHAHVRAFLELDLIDHRYNLATPDVRYAVDAMKIVDVPVAPGRFELRVKRPSRADVATFDADVASGDDLTFDAARKIVSGLTLDALPLVPIDEPLDQASERARRARLEFLDEARAPFGRGALTSNVHLVLDANRIDETVDLVDAAGVAGWLASEPDPLQRRCALLETTFVAAPWIPTPHLARIEDAVWRCDAITLADYAEISSPAAPANVTTRQLTGRWVPILERTIPRLTGLLADRHVFLAPGHGFYDNNPAGSAGLVGWVSYRGGYDFAAGEDENDGYMAANVLRIFRAHDTRVHSAREISDFTIRGVTHLANDVFAPAAGADFLRLWQQNPVYYLGAAGDALVIGTVRGHVSRIAHPPAGPNGKGHDNDGVNARIDFAKRLAAAAANPLDLYLAIHTNAVGGRGTLALYLDVTTSSAVAAEANQLGLDFAQRLVREIAARCLTRNQGTRSVRVNGATNRELQSTYEHWTRNPRWDVFPDVDVAEATWRRFRDGPLPAVPAPPAVPPMAPPPANPPQPWINIQFPGGGAAARRIPVALAEVAAHDQADDANLLTREWFRRRAAEAMAIAVEEQLRANTAAISRDDMVRVLLGVFGPTPRIRRLVAGAAVITGDIARYVREATEPPPPRGAPPPPAVPDRGTLEEAVRAIETVAIVDVGAGRPAATYTRRNVVDAIIGVLNERCGYTGDAARRIAPAAPPRIEYFVTRTVLAGDTLAQLTRPDHAPTRGDVGEMIALALGLQPATIASVIAARPDGKILMSQLEGADHADKLVPRSEAEDVLALIAGLRPETFYVINDIVIADDDFVPLPSSGAGPRTYAIRKGTRVCFVANTRGTPWEIGDVDPRFVIERDGTKVIELISNTRTRDRLMSTGWDAAFPIPEGEEVTFTIGLTLQHRTLKATLRHTTTVKVKERV